MHCHCGTNNRAPRWTFTDPCKQEVRLGAWEGSASPAWLAAPAMYYSDFYFCRSRKPYKGNKKKRCSLFFCIAASLLNKSTVTFLLKCRKRVIKHQKCIIFMYKIGYLNATLSNDDMTDNCLQNVRRRRDQNIFKNKSWQIEQLFYLWNSKYTYGKKKRYSAEIITS